MRRVTGWEGRLTVGAGLIALLLVTPAWAADSQETLQEQALALAAEQGLVLPPAPSQLEGTMQVTHPLFVGVDDTTVSTYLGDPSIPEWLPQFTGFQVWGAAFDPDNNKVYLNNGSTLYEWPVGGAVATLGTIVDGAGATQSMVALAFYDGVLYGTKNIANEAIWMIDPTTLVATVFIDYVDGDLDCGGLAVDPNSGTFYCTNDDSTPYGASLVIVNPDASVTPVAAYPTGETDIDGLAVSDTGVAYLITDQTGNFYPYDLVGGAYGTPFANPWASSEVFCGGTWLYEPGGGGLTLCNGPVALPATGTSTGPADPYPSDVTVAGYPGLVTDLNIRLGGLSHTYPDDLDFMLVGPSGDNLILMSDAGGGTDLVAVELVFDDDASGPLPDSTAITSGTYLPTNYVAGDTFPPPAPTPSPATALAVFNDTDPNGTWSLYAFDDAGGDVGDLVEWCLVLNGGSVNPAITLNKTVGTDSLTCATTDEITVAAGTEVYYCYEVTNIGDVALELHDLDDDQLGSILNDFAFTLDPGVTINTVDAGLTIPATIVATTVNTATWRAFTPGGPSAEATDSATVNVIFPDIDVSPASLAASQLVGTTTQQVLTIGNTGQAVLDWLIDEAPPNAPAQHFPPMPNPSGYGGPAPAAEVLGEVGVVTMVEKDYGPPAMWDAPQLVLYDNGPLVTHPGGGAGGADASALQTALGLTLYGFGHQVSAGNRMADDFTVTDANWTIETITFFAYQTGSTTTSTITAVNLQIWDGPPDNPASTVVWGDTTTNVLTSTTWSNIYRVLDTTLADNQRPIMASTVTVNTSLPAGTYWLDWQADGTLASGPWAPPISILGTTTTGNALQYTSTTGAWAAALDGTFQQGLPFVIEGTSSNCYSPSDIPWLSASPSAGSTPAAGSSTVDVTFDATAVPVGTYDALLCVFSNDPDEPLVEVPVQMEVVIPVELMGIEIE